MKITRSGVAQLKRQADGSHGDFPRGCDVVGCGASATSTFLFLFSFLLMRSNSRGCQGKCRPAGHAVCGRWASVYRAAAAKANVNFRKGAQSLPTGVTRIKLLANPRPGRQTGRVATKENQWLTVTGKPARLGLNA